MLENERADVSHTATPSPPELRCSGPDWHEFGDFCYKPFGDKKTWFYARETCRSLGADLVSIMSMTEQSWLESYLYLGVEKEHELQIASFETHHFNEYFHFYPRLFQPPATCGLV